MNAHTAPIAYTLQNAFAASGYIHGPLMRLQWSDRFAAMEQDLAAAWKAEAKPADSRPVDPRIFARAHAANLASRESAAAKARENRIKRTADIVALLSQGRKTRVEIEAMVNFRGGALKDLLRDLCNDGLIRVAETQGPMRRAVYELTMQPVLPNARKAAQQRAVIDRADRRARIMTALKDGPKSRSDLAEIACLAHATTRRFLADMCADGLIIATTLARTEQTAALGGKRGRLVVYEVAQ